MIVSPPKAGKTTILKNIAAAISANNPEVHLMCLLVDERPEEVTDMERSIKGEVISSTFDMPSENHIACAEMVIERAKRLVENGETVLVIEHNLDVIKTADYIIDLGPEGGDKGGTIVATGTPEQICEVKESYTGRYLKPILERDRQRMADMIEQASSK